MESHKKTCIPSENFSKPPILPSLTYALLREAAKKVLLLMAGPIRPSPLPPHRA